MEKLPKDMINKLIDELSPQDFINFCASNTSNNIIRICNMNEIWLKRMQRDYPFIVAKLEKNRLDNSKEIYLQIFSRIAKFAETFTELVLNEYGQVRQFLSSAFKVLLNDHFYKLAVEAIKDVFADEDFGDDNTIHDMVPDTFFKFADFQEAYFRNDDLNHWFDEIVDPLRELVREMVGYSLGVYEFEK